MSLSWWAAGPFVYFAVVVFVTVTTYKIILYSRMPRHLRWDLYPIPHQGSAGSKYQIVDFSDRMPRVSKRHELLAMLEEMVWIKKAFVNNRKLWYGSFPLHIGIYLSAMWLLLLVVGTVLELAGISVDAAGWAAFSAFSRGIGVLGMLLGLSGSVLLLWLRLNEAGLRAMSDPVTYYNIILLVVLFASGMVAWLIVDPTFAVIRGHIKSLLTFQPTLVHPLIAWELFCFATFLCLLPFSRMMHYAAKYFFYHRILWDDEAVKAGGELEQDVSRYLNYHTSWSADHIANDKTWSEQVKQPEKVKSNE